MRGIVNKKGELFAYLEGDQLYTLDDEMSGYLKKEFIVDLAGGKVWRVVGDGIYTLDGTEIIGYIGEDRAARYDF